MTDLEYLEKYYTGNIDNGKERLKNSEPVQYIVGNVDFYGNIIKIDKRVLIPRFETEGLVEIALKYLTNTKIDVVDLGTGSGCIPITLKKKLPNINIDAVDISVDALDVARENAKLHNVEINFINGDMLKPLSKKYDCIISNPPYIAYDEEIMDIVKENEPDIALYASNNGLYYYEEILKNCKKLLKENSLIAFEIGYKQGQAVIDLAHKYLNCDVTLEQDLQGKDRFIFIQIK